MSDPDSYLAIDAGGTVLKAAVFDVEGRQLALASAAVETRFHAGGRVERDPESMWQAAADATRQITRDRIAPARIAAVACTGFGNGLFLVDERHRATRPGIVSVDHRARNLVQSMPDDLAERVQAISGNHVWGGQSLLQLAWLSRHEPAVLQASRHALLCKDFIRLRLTGVAATDWSDASGGGLLNLYDARPDAALFELLEIADGERLMPPPLDSSARAGEVSAAAAEATGLIAGTPVAIGMMDVSASAIGSGVSGADALTMTAGTWSINSLESEQAVRGDVPILQMLHRDRSAVLVAEGSPTSAANLSWYLEQVMHGALEHATVDELIAACEVRRSRCHFMPYVNGPEPLRGGFVGLQHGDGQGSLLRAIYEGVVFRHRAHADAVRRFLPDNVPVRIRLAGGAARSRLWPQVFADVCQLPVTVVEGDEIGALGAACAAAVCAGHRSDLASAGQGMSRISREYRPDLALRDFYDQRFAEFRELDDWLTRMPPIRTS